MPKLVGEAVVKDQFPDEHLFDVTVTTLRYVDVTNYLAVGKLPKDLVPNEWKQIV